MMAGLDETRLARGDELAGDAAPDPGGSPGDGGDPLSGRSQRA
jgi:hypothetical protein